MHGAQRRERAAEGDGQERAFAEILAWTAVTRFLVARLPLESLVDLPSGLLPQTSWKLGGRELSRI